MPVLLVSGILVMGFQFTMVWLIRDVGPDLVWLQLTFTPEAFFERMAQWSPVQQSQYRSHLAPDYLYPWTYAFFLMCWLAACLQTHRAPHRANVFLVTPWIIAVCDCLENSAHLWMIHQTEALTLVAMCGGICATIKWTLASALLIGLLLATTAGLVSRSGHAGDSEATS